jgi:hypothetical protein
VKNKNPESERHSRREFIRKAAYATPVVLTLSAAPSFAQQGSGGGSGGGDTGGGDPGGGPRPASEFNCDEPLQPIDSDVATNMCEGSLGDGQEILFEDIIVSQDAVPGRLAEGDLFGTCDSFICNAS